MTVDLSDPAPCHMQCVQGGITSHPMPTLWKMFINISCKEASYIFFLKVLKRYANVNFPTVASCLVSLNIFEVKSFVL